MHDDSLIYVDASDLMRKDTRTAAERWLDREMDRRGANEMGADDTRILRQIAIELAETLCNNTVPPGSGPSQEQ